MLFWRKATAIYQLHVLEAKRAETFQKALDAEVARLKQEVTDGAVAVHEQCLKDFDRAYFLVGTARFEQGEAARKASSPDESSAVIDKARAAFVERLLAECEGYDEAFIRVVSAMMSQISMAHLAAACFTGPHSYAFPSGHCRVSYSLERNGSLMRILLDRHAKDITAFALPDGEEHRCRSDSFVRQSAELILRQPSDDGSAGSIGLSVKEVNESIRLVWPDGDFVVHDGLVLNFTSGSKGASSKFSAVRGRCRDIVVYFIGQVLDMAERCLPSFVIKAARDLLGIYKMPIQGGRKDD